MNETLRVPTIRVEASIRYAGHELLHGSIFIPTLAHYHDGPMRPDEFMNQPSLFFPFIPDGAESAVLMNKTKVSVLAVPSEAELFDVLEEAGIERRVAVDVEGEHYRGTVRIDMPSTQQRLLDFLNRSENFIGIWDEDGETYRLVSKTSIDRIVEVREE